mmetsp:Transcript_85851/g.255981  ORF Transcript_85851/g.255981 Transcript_85851/m.255981 type:complete len:350 (-) Transcript_85851:251-1300(-)
MKGLGRDVVNRDGRLRPLGPPAPLRQHGVEDGAARAEHHPVGMHKDLAALQRETHVREVLAGQERAEVGRQVVGRHRRRAACGQVQHEGVPEELRVLAAAKHHDARAWQQGRAVPAAALWRRAGDLRCAPDHSVRVQDVHVVEEGPLELALAAQEHELVAGRRGTVPAAASRWTRSFCLRPLPGRVPAGDIEDPEVAELLPVEAAVHQYPLLANCAHGRRGVAATLRQGLLVRRESDLLPSTLLPPGIQNVDVVQGASDAPASDDVCPRLDSGARSSAPPLRRLPSDGRRGPGQRVHIQGPRGSAVVLLADSKHPGPLVASLPVSSEAVDVPPDEVGRVRRQPGAAGRL